MAQIKVTDLTFAYEGTAEDVLELPLMFESIGTITALDLEGGIDVG